MAKLPSPVRVKICGMTSAQDALHAAECGADAVGFIFHKKSPRFITPREAKVIAAELPPFVLRVGVFVNETVERIHKIADNCGLDIVQLHGIETPAFCNRIRKKVIKVFRVQDAESLASLAQFKVDGFLLDTFKDGQFGGTGQVFDWALVKQAKKFGTVIVAGGLNSSNIAEAIEKSRPYAVDVCSGVEKKPGIKDLKKVQEFIEAAKGF